MSMVDQALERPRDYASLAACEQWAIDKRLGILDWDPTPEDVAEFTRRWEAGEVPEEKPSDAERFRTFFIEAWGQAKESPRYDKKVWSELDLLRQTLIKR